VKTEKLGGAAGGEGECGDDAAGWLVRERRSLDILDTCVRPSCRRLLVWLQGTKVCRYSWHSAS